MSARKNTLWILAILAILAVLGSTIRPERTAEVHPPARLGPPTADDIRYVCWTEIDNCFKHDTLTYEFWCRPEGGARYRISFVVPREGQVGAEAHAQGTLEADIFGAFRRTLQNAHIWEVDSHSMCEQERAFDLLVRGKNHQHEAHWLGAPDEAHCDLMNAFLNSPVRPEVARLQRELIEAYKRKWGEEPPSWGGFY